jgi:2-polyprenyl-3-methyl-5-hydroxy-6-metoxy-1,4-benzoquinol methylase
MQNPKRQRRMWGLIDRLITTRRFKSVRKYLHGDILDIGCGDAQITNYFKDNAINSYMGIDSDDELIRELKNKYSERNKTYRFIALDCEEGQLPHEQEFDVILMLAFLEHVKNPENIISQSRGMLKENGSLVITTPTIWGDRILKLLLKTLNPKEKDSVKKPHITIWNKLSLKQTLEQLGFSIDKYFKFELGANQIVIASKNVNN